jgi:signal transduction histidine kinase/ligand-binding sensor domain-containing protein
MEGARMTLPHTPPCRLAASLTVFVIFTLTPVRAPAASSQDYLVHVWQTDNGLPQNWVSSIAQTPDGYLWIGTRHGGLARFDGVRFVHFNPQNTPEFLDMQVERLTVDAQGTMWIATTDQSITAMRGDRFELFRRPRTGPELRIATVLHAGGGTVVFNTENGEIARLDHAKGREGWSISKPAPAARAFSYNIYPSETFCRDRNGAYWYIDQNRLLACMSENGGAQALPDPLLAALVKHPRTNVNAIEIDANGALWIITDRQILSWDGCAAEDHTPPGTGALADVRQVALSGGDGLWIVEKQRLRKLARKTWVAEADPRLLGGIMSSRHYQLYGDSRGGAWIVSYGQGLLHARADGRTQLLTEKDGLPSRMLTCWFEDNEGNVWIGTTGDGLARIRDLAFRVVGEAEGMPEKIVCSVGVDAAGGIWAGTISGQLTHWRDGAGRVVTLPPVETTPIGGIAIWPSRDGTVWIGSLYHGLRPFRNGRLGQPVPMRGATFIRAFLEDKRGDLWIGQFGALCRYTPATGKINYFGSNQGFQANTGVGAFAEDANGALWIGVESGDLWRYENGGFTRHQRPAEWPRSRCVSLLADADGTVWMGTLGNGLVRFRDGRFTRFGTRNGLPDDNVSQLLDDGAGNLWCGTYAGIMRIKKTEIAACADGKTAALMCTVFVREDGLPALECTAGFSPACWRADGGRLLFATVNGLVIVNPADVKPNRWPPGVVIEELHVDGKLRALTAGRSRELGALEIEPGKHFLQFRYTGLSYSAPEKVRFRWKIDGINRDWQDGGTQRIIGIGPLEPGHYRLRVLASNSDGVWNEKGDTLDFRVLPYFWETAWFKAALAFLVLALIAGIGAMTQRARYRRRLREAERQRELERERTRIAQDLHDDLGTSLTQISMLGALANHDGTPPSETREIIQKIDDCAHGMVIALDEIVWAVNPKNDSWYELANYLGFFAEEFFQPTGIRCRLDIPPHVPFHPLSSEERHHLFLAVKEALNNVARHSGAGQVLLRVSVGADEVAICVEDDGRGFKQDALAKHSEGNGLNNMRHRMAQMGGSVELRNGPDGRGTVVTFRIPLATGSGSSR